MRPRAVFLDKDGTLVDDVPFNVDVSRTRWVPEAARALTHLYRHGYQLLIVSNQSGISEGYFSEQALKVLEKAMADKMRGWGIPLAGFYYCPHREMDMCSCRKPQPGLLYQAAADRHVDLSQSWFVGDILNDVEAGKRAGCRTVLLRNGHETQWHKGPYRTPDFTAHDLMHAAHLICQENSYA